MPKRKQTALKRRVSPLTTGETNYLYDLDQPLDDPWTSRYFMSKDEIEALWTDNRADVLEWWTGHKPCTRPGPWWKHDAPLEDTPTRVWGVIEERRRDRIGGTGTPCYECLNYAPQFDHGIPDSWVSQFDADYYNGRRKDIHGKPIGTEYTEGHFKGLAIDPTDPPVYESQAAYLQRHGLLTPAEKKYMASHPELMEPEQVTAE